MKAEADCFTGQTRCGNEIKIPFLYGCILPVTSIKNQHINSQSHINWIAVGINGHIDHQHSASFFCDFLKFYFYPTPLAPLLNSNQCACIIVSCVNGIPPITFYR